MWAETHMSFLMPLPPLDSKKPSSAISSIRLDGSCSYVRSCAAISPRLPAKRRYDNATSGAFFAPTPSRKQFAISNMPNDRSLCLSA